MMPLIASLFTTAMELSAGRRALFILPLCLSIAVVYKTVRCADVREIPLAAVVLWVTMILGMYAVGVGLWLLYLLVA